ncbi:MAG: DUF2442 domain-containing protein [Desulfovermiculus sp.]|nr:DUF2442 domain-containing protein [Desulfovermiculus sp.]
MSTLAVNIETLYAVNVQITEDTITVDLSDGRTISAPLAWFPRLEYANSEERANWRLIGKGQGIYWEDLDEDISVDGLLAGRPSGESKDSLKKWLVGRRSPSPNQSVNRMPERLEALRGKFTDGAGYYHRSAGRK